jgi:hypothetical protein
MLNLTSSLYRLMFVAARAALIGKPRGNPVGAGSTDDQPALRRQDPKRSPVSRLGRSGFGPASLRGPSRWPGTSSQRTRSVDGDGE